MPQLLSRLDETGWLTPAIADVLEAGAAPPNADVIRAQAQEIQQTLQEAGTPVRIEDIRQTTAYTLFITQPETIGRLGNRRAVTANDLQRGLKVLSDKHRDWRIALVPALERGGEGAIGIVLRTSENRPLRLRQLMLSNTFQENDSNLALPIGVTLEQGIILRDLKRVGHLLIIGSGTAKRHLLQGMLLTLITMNTPAEVRIALAGTHSDTHDALLNTPHALGRLLSTPEDAQRLFDGLVKEVQRRRKWFKDNESGSLEEYNAKLRERDEDPLQRIILMIDSLSDTGWQESNDRWAPSIYDLVINGARVGVHLILAADKLDAPDVPHILNGTIRSQIILRAAAGDMPDELPNYHRSAQRFTDAFVVNDGRNRTVTPVALYAVPDEEMQNAVDYWQRITEQRQEETQTENVVAPSGVTGYLRMTPEVAAALGEEPPPPTTPTPDALARAAKALANPTDEEVLKRSEALAAYLGWLGTGPLQDIFGLTVVEARAILDKLADKGVLENNENSTMRFVRLAENPLSKDETLSE